MLNTSIEQLSVSLKPEDGGDAAFLNFFKFLNFLNFFFTYFLPGVGGPPEKKKSNPGWLVRRPGQKFYFPVGKSSRAETRYICF
jgi:hypothetical protein